MNVTDELERLSQLRKDGALTNAEFAQAKNKLLNQQNDSEPGNTSDNSLGEAANRYVTFRMVMGVLGFILFLIVFLTVFLPHMNSSNGPFGR
jgi:hypothetical protein